MLRREHAADKAFLRTSARHSRQEENLHDSAGVLHDYLHRLPHRLDDSPVCAAESGSRTGARIPRRVGQHHRHRHIAVVEERRRHRLLRHNEQPRHGNRSGDCRICTAAIRLQRSVQHGAGEQLHSHGVRILRQDEKEESRRAASRDRTAGKRIQQEVPRVARPFHTHQRTAGRIQPLPARHPIRHDNHIHRPVLRGA